MRKGTQIMAAVAVALALAGAGRADTINPDGTVQTGNLVVNGSAEVGLSGWDASPGWTTTSYNASPGEHLGMIYSDEWGQGFFDPAAQLDARMTQTVDLRAYAAAIDTGHQPFAFLFGVLTWRDREDTATLSATPLADDGTPTGAPVEIGGPSAADRGGNSALVVCRAQLPALAVGTRSIRLDIHAAATAAPDHAGVDGIVGLLGAPWWNPTLPPGVHPIAKGCTDQFAMSDFAYKAPPNTGHLPAPPADDAPPVIPPSAPPSPVTLSAPAKPRLAGRYAAVKLVSSAAGTASITLSAAPPGLERLARVVRKLRAGTTTIHLPLSAAERKRARRHQKVRVLGTLKTADGRTATARVVRTF